MLIPVLESFVEFQGIVAEADRRHLISGAVYKAATETTFDRTALEKNLKGAEDDYLRKRPQKFIIATSWTASPDLAMKRLRSGGATISFAQSKASFDREPVRNLLEQVTPSPLTEMLQVQARVGTYTIRGFGNRSALLRLRKRGYGTS